jgi:hypothetical protein
MAQAHPGLEPRKLEDQTNVVMKVESPRVSELTAEQNEPKVSEEPTVQVEDNTQTAEPKEPEETQEEAPVEDREFSERASKRFQELANRTSVAEARAQQAEQMLQRMVNTQVQPPAPSQDELLAKQFKSFDQTLGYPTDAKEYMRFAEVKAELAAERKTTQMNEESQKQRQIDELIEAFPEVLGDNIMQGAISAEVADAKKKGMNITYKQAAKRVYSELESRANKKATIASIRDTKEKNEAYVETTKGAAQSRSVNVVPDSSKMTLKEMEKWMKENGSWNE